MEKIKFHSGEKFEKLPIPKSPTGMRYAITNYGRIIAFTDEVENGKILKGSKTATYPSITLRVKGNPKVFYIHRLVASYFLRQPSKEYKIVIHRNHNKEDNHYQNLQWVTDEHAKRHNRVYKQENELGNYKLTESRVKLIKGKLLNGKTRYKMIAKQFGVSEGHIYKIKNGIAWKQVKVE